MQQPPKSVIGERVWGRGSQDDKSGLIGEHFIRMLYLRVLSDHGCTGIMYGLPVAYRITVHYLRFAPGRPWRVCWRTSFSQPEPWFWRLGSMKKRVGFM